MELDEHAAAIDNDFTNHLVEANLDDDCLVESVRLVFAELALSVAMHPLIYENELMRDNPRICMMFDRGVLNKAEFADIHQNDTAKKTYYAFLVENLYRDINGEAIPFSKEEIFTRWIKKANLGELHSVAMCLICGCGIFLSDDKDSKKLQTLINNKSLGNITIYNRKELIEVHLKRGTTKLSRKVRQSLGHLRT